MPKDITSPFSPGRPVPVEFFVGRKAEILALHEKVRRSLEGHVEVGFVVGERGIGKSSLASFVRSWCEQSLDVLGLHTLLGGVESLEEMVRCVFEQLVKESVGTDRLEKLKSLFGERIKKVGFFGVSVEFGTDQRELRRIVHSFAPALRSLLEKFQDEKKGILLILDDINGLAQSLEFANWLKSLVDEISVSRSPLPLCILLVGLEDKRESLIELQPSLARVFSVTDVRSWSDEETRDFFVNAFAKVGIEVTDDALETFVFYAGGLPVLAHEIGDVAFGRDSDGVIRQAAALSAVTAAAEVVGRKYLQPKVFSSIRSSHYRGILRKIAAEDMATEFTRADMLKRLSPKESKNLDNLLKKLRELGVIARNPERGRGCYRFTNTLHRVYFHLEARRALQVKD